MAGVTSDSATINWGDGAVTKGTVVFDSTSNAFIVSGTHLYNPAAAPKIETVTTTVFDHGIKRATAVGMVNIIPPYPTTTPSMVHDYTGTAKIGGLIGGLVGSHSFEINITNQTLTSLTGQITFDGQTVLNGTLNAGVISGITKGELSNGNFYFVYTGSTSVTISGTLSKSGTSISNGLIVATGVPIPGFSSINAHFTLTAVS
jgi:hypothetical protein